MRTLRFVMRTSYDGNLPDVDFFSDDEAKISELFEAVLLVSFETTKNSPIGGHITRIETWQDRLYVMNETAAGKNIICFHIDGNFILKIDRIGRGSGEYSILSDFVIDNKCEEIMLFPEPGRYITLDMDGNYVSEYKV